MASLGEWRNRLGDGQTSAGVAADGYREFAPLPGPADVKRPALAVGLHDTASLARFVESGVDVVAVEPNPARLRAAARSAPAAMDGMPVYADIPEGAARAAFDAYLERRPRVLVSEAASADEAFLARTLRDMAARAPEAERLRICVGVGISHVLANIGRFLTDAFRRLGHDCTLVDNRALIPIREEVEERRRRAGRDGQPGDDEALMGQLLLQWSLARILEAKPQICLLLDSVQDPLHAQLMAMFVGQLQAQGVRVAYWYLDDFRRTPDWTAYLPSCDAVFHLQPEEFDPLLEAQGCRRHRFVQTGCDAERHRPVALAGEDSETFVCDVSFAGLAYPNRRRVLAGMNGCDLRVWGPGWNTETAPAATRAFDGPFTPETYAKIISGSRINLSLHFCGGRGTVPAGGDAVSSRLFEIAAAGGFLLTDRCDGLDRHFDPRSEMATYGSVEELHDKVGHYLTHPGERTLMAQLARKRALECHTYERRAEEMLPVLRDCLP